MSAVKNLRAMFEQKAESPPDRGRSPGVPRGPGTDSPRPLSKVRTSFVAVEKDGRIGLQREGSQDSISAVRKLSGDSTVTTPTAGTEKSNPFDNQAKPPAKTRLQNQPILESPGSDSGRKHAAENHEEAPAVKPVASSGADVAPNVPKSNGTVGREVTSSSGPTSEAGKAGRAGSDKEPQKTTGAEAAKQATRTTKPAPKPLSASAAATKPAQKPERSPTSQKGPKTPTATSTPHHVAKKTPEKKTQPPEKPATPRATPRPKATGPSSVKRSSAHPSSPSAAGFVKPRPKSPTRPVKLPPSLTTHTASSGSKVNAPRQSLSRASGTTLPSEPHGRSASRASASTAGSAPHKPAPIKGLRRQSSTINRPRPSLGPPPKQPAKDHPPTRREKEVDQGFLARMMRPTQSSASKATEKILTSPPRKTAAVPKKAASAKPISKVAPKATGAAQSSAQQQISAAKQVTRDVEPAAAADEAIGTAEPAEGEASVPIDASQKSSAQEVAPITEQSETVEQAIAAAEDAGDEAVLHQTPATVAVVEQPSKVSEPEPVVAAGEPTVDGPEETHEVAVSTEEVSSAEPTENAASEEKGDAPEMAAA